MSVILPVRNAEAWIRDAVMTLLSQTYNRLEILVVDNNSTDRSWEIVKSIEDDRIVQLHQPEGFLVSTLNKGLMYAKGLLIARQDADDLSKSTRIRAQVDLLREHEDIEIVGCSYHIISADGVFIKTNQAYAAPSQVRKRLVNAMPFAGASILGSRFIFDALHGYDTAFDGAVGEDYDFLVRAAELTNISAVDEPLYVYRTGNPLSMCGLINYNYDAAKDLVRRRALARGSRFFLETEYEQ